MFFQSRQGSQSNFIVPNKPAVGVAGLIFGILMIVVAILSLAIPSMEGALDLVILIVFSVWMVVNGFISIVSIVLCKLVKVSCIGASYDLHYPMT